MKKRKKKEMRKLSLILVVGIIAILMFLPFTQSFSLPDLAKLWNDINKLFTQIASFFATLTNPEKIAEFINSLKGIINLLNPSPDWCGFVKDVIGVGIRDMTNTKTATGPLEEVVPVIDFLMWGSSLTWGLYYASVTTKGEGGCAPQPSLTGTGNCGKCNEDPYMYCSKERCLALGSCTAVPDADKKGSYLCVEGPCDQVGKPYVDEISLKYITTDGAEYNAGSCREGTSCDQLSNEGNIKRLLWDAGKLDSRHAGKLVRAIKLTVKTEGNYTACKYALEPNTNFSDAIGFDDYPAFTKVHNATLTLGSGGILPRYNESYTIYIKCQSPCEGKVEADDFSVKFHLNDLDVIAPEFEYFDPPIESAVVSTKQQYANITFQINEQGHCYFSTPNNGLVDEIDKMYDIPNVPDNETHYIKGISWTNNADCLTRRGHKCGKATIKLDITKNQSNGTVINWDCIRDPTICGAPGDWHKDLSQDDLDLVKDVQQNFNVSGISRAYLFIFRCKDPDNNIGYARRYMLLTVPPYNITIISPNSSRDYWQGDPLPIKVITDRQAECRYAITDPNQQNKPNWDDLENNVITSNDNLVHEMSIDTIQLTTGQRKFWAICRDLVWRLELNKTSLFTLKNDTTPPNIIRMWADTAGNGLIVETDEPAKCYYSIDENKECNYNFDEVEPMQSNDEMYEHIAPLNMEWTYYIKCKDRFNNTKTGCTAIIKPFELPRS